MTTSINKTMQRYSELAAELIKNAGSSDLARLALGTRGVGAVGLVDSESFSLTLTAGLYGPVQSHDRAQDVDTYLSMPCLVLSEDDDGFRELLERLSPQTAAAQMQDYLDQIDTPEGILADLMDDATIQRAVREALLLALAGNCFEVLDHVEVEIQTAIEHIEQARLMDTTH